MTTRMNILTEKYIKFYNDINLINNSYSHLFPSLEDIDMVDLLFFFNYTFTRGTDYNEPIKSLMNSNDIIIDEDEYKKAFPIIKEFIEYLFYFQKL